MGECKLTRRGKGETPEPPTGITYLYNEGDECVSLTGGWIVYKDYYASGSQKNATNIRLYWSGGSNIGSSNTYTSNAIDVTNYSKLVIRWVCDAIYSPNRYYGWALGDKSTSTDLASGKTTFAEVTSTYDISSLTSIVPVVSQYGASVYLYEMWLEV